MSLLDVEDSYNSDEDEDYVEPADAPQNVNADLIAKAEEKEKKVEDKPTKDADELWADFLKDDDASTSETKEEKPKEEEKVVKVYDFAGERVEVETKIKPGSNPFKRAAPKSGLDSVLSALKKPKKMTVLDKSKHDWGKFVEEENIEAELEKHKKSKDSFLDKQKFISSVDQSKFERERQQREQTRQR
ncbi:unnamed protein product [Bursaphelenchus xylophilus]|uniref:Craniofacial development protein 1 n=1 Tax=Bursaphelenchus xylophilus TaxID=6326 RepID=A0A1I7S204_BURXY|nr:unnamed protein product [Bursaphelenchus xylophilus]CAG9090227.1 unnamed protein product [Bursaphelenchus xylophilus]